MRTCIVHVRTTSDLTNLLARLATVFSCTRSTRCYNKWINAAAMPALVQHTRRERHRPPSARSQSCIASAATAKAHQRSKLNSKLCIAAPGRVRPLETDKATKHMQLSGVLAKRAGRCTVLLPK